MELTYQTFDNTILDPKRAHDTDSGWDLFSDEDITLKKNDLKTLRTQTKFKIPDPFILKVFRFLGLPLYIEAQIRPKSGRSMNGLEVSLGTIDNSYRGFTGVTVYNRSKKEIIIKKYEKIAQIVFTLVFTGKTFNLVRGKVDEDTDRGNKGFGSTSLK